MDNLPEKSPEEIIADYKASRAAKNKNLTKFVLIGIFALVVLYVIGNNSENKNGSNTTTNSSTSTDVEAYDDTWIPSGFTGYVSDDNIAWRWGTKTETNCSYSSGSCWTVVLIAKNGCPQSLYGEVNIFDKGDIQISYTNDTLGTVQPMQKVKLTFDTLDELAQSANISKFSCY